VQGLSNSSLKMFTMLSETSWERIAFLNSFLDKIDNNTHRKRKKKSYPISPLFPQRNGRRKVVQAIINDP